MGLDRLEAMLEATVKSGQRHEQGADRTQLSHLAAFARRPGTTTICEIGFNCGFSSWAFLAASPSVRVWSFDLAHFRYSAPAKAHIDALFPGRHTLVVGDSRVTVPRFAADHPGARFDLIFIDGDHSVEGARADLQNLRALAGPRTVLIMDDITPWLWWGAGPTQAWEEAVEARSVHHHGSFRDGLRVETVEPPARRAWAVGQYIGA